MNATTTITPDDNRGEDADIFHHVIDSEAANAIFKAMSVLAMGIEATLGRSLDDRVYLEWPQTAEAAWDQLDSIMIRAGVSDGKERPWVSADD